MATWASILEKSAALNNDQTRAVFTDAVMLPYLNIALSELQEIFELNNIPSTNEVSALINVPAGTTVVGFSTVPALPAALVEIRELFESVEGQESWVPVTKKEYLTPSQPGPNVGLTSFGIWSWLDQEIHVLEAIVDIDLKLDYIKSIFVDITLGGIAAQNTILNTDTFLQYRTAGLASEFIDEDFARADRQNNYGVSGLERSLGISIKGKQSIVVRRRPFRAAFKRRRTMF